jgi:hypothetical protein
MTSARDAHNNGATTTTTTTAPFVLLFFLSMIGHELALESLSTAYNSFPHLATSITLFQFGFCVLLPLAASSRACAGGGDAATSFPKSIKELWMYAQLSAVVYGATACATMSLTYDGVNYVTKVVFKSEKDPGCSQIGGGGGTARWNMPPRPSFVSARLDFASLPET